MLFELAFHATRPRLIVAVILLASIAAAQNRSVRPHQVDGEFTRSKAMGAIYGNYSFKSRSSTVQDLSDYAPLLGKVVGLVRVMLDAPYSENGTNYRVLVTYAVPRDVQFECHPCAPSVSAFVFEQRGNKWELKSAGYDLSVGGGLGRATRLRLIEIGSSRHALMARPSYVAQGDVTEEVSIFIPTGESFDEVFNLSTLSDNLTNCEDRKVDCARETANFEFIRDPAKDIWDIRVTEREVVNGTVATGARISTYEFTNGKYVRTAEAQ